MGKNENVSVILNLKEAIVSVLVDDYEASRMEFIFDLGHQIMVTSVKTEPLYERNGYAKLMFTVLKALAEYYKMPIVLWSLNDAIKFYEKIGFLHLNDPEVQKLINIGNIEDEVVQEKLDEDDFVWLPQSLLGRKPTIYL